MINNGFWILWMKYFKKLIFPAIFATLRIVITTIALGFSFGFLLAILLIIYGPEGLKPRKNIYKILDFILNTIRSFPILILIVAVSPLTRKIVGTTIGEKAAILPLTIAATSFIARNLENTFKVVDKQLIEAARSFGASDLQIVFRVIIRESIPSIINIATIVSIHYIAASTMAGAVGAGGLGAVAINYGYQSFNNIILYTSVFIIFIMVQITQYMGDKIYKKLL